MMPSRSPSRRQEQKKLRKKHVDLICRKICNRLANDTERATTTNRILPVGSLKRESVRMIFQGWICKFRGNGRCFTKRLSKDVCRRLRNELGLDREIPEDEPKRLLALLKHSWKLGLTNRRKMDNVETQELQRTHTLQSQLCFWGIETSLCL